MSVTTRTNLLTNPSFELNAAEWTAHGNCTSAVSTSSFYVGTQSLAVTATASGAVAIATTSGTGGVPVTASTSYSFSAYVHYGATGRAVTPQIIWYTAAGAIISTSSGAAIGDSSAWAVRVNVQATSPSNAAFCAVQLTYASEAAAEVHYIDAALLEQTTALGGYFDGSFTNGAGIIYAWTGTANASTSTMITYVPSITLVAKNDPPTDRVIITVADLAPGDSTVNLWRTADGVRKTVAGAKHWYVNTSNAITDYAPPLARVVSYDLEVLTGISAGVAAPTANVTVAATHGWIQDPLVPSSAIPLYGDVGPGGEAGLDDSAVKNIEFNSTITVLEIQGSDEPIALIGQRQAGSNISFDMTTDSAVHAGELLTLIKQAAPLLIRTLPEWSGALPGLCYLAIPKEVQLPQNEAWGGTIIHWSLTGDLVRAPSSNVLVAAYTYTTVAAMWSTYQQAQTTLSGLGRTYLDVLKSPSGA